MHRSSARLFLLPTCHIACFVLALFLAHDESKHTEGYTHASSPQACSVPSPHQTLQDCPAEGTTAVDAEVHLLQTQLMDLEVYGVAGLCYSSGNSAGSLATAASAAAALHVPQSRIANSLAFLADRAGSPSSSSMPVVLVVRGDQRVDMRKAMPLTLHGHAPYLPLCRRRCRLGLARCPAARCPAAADPPCC